MQTQDMKNIVDQLSTEGYDFGVAIATQEEIKNGAACGQLSIVIDANQNAQ
jgi:hypothetical protein